MKKISNYVVVSGEYGDFRETVKGYIDDGYEPCGGVSVRHSENNFRDYYYQAMVKYEEEIEQDNSIKTIMRPKNSPPGDAYLSLEVDDDDSVILGGIKIG